MHEFFNLVGSVVAVAFLSAFAIGLGVHAVFLLRALVAEVRQTPVNVDSIVASFFWLGSLAIAEGACVWAFVIAVPGLWGYLRDSISGFVSVL